MKPVTTLWAAALLALSACNSNHIEFTGKAPGLTNGVFLVQDGSNTLFSDEIKTGTFHAAGALDHPGYYSISIMDNSNTKARHEPFEVYLENGNYTIEANEGIDKYPKITCNSKIQQDLSDYYAIRERSVDAVDALVKELSIKLSSRKPLSKFDYLNLSARLSDAEKRKGDVTLDAFRTFVNEHPKSEITAHLMEKLPYDENPVAYNAIYQKFSPAAKDSEEGKVIGEKLKSLLRLLPGAEAPEISGLTPDGKKFNKTALDKKIYIIDFWRAGNEVSRLNHQDMLSSLLPQLDKRKVGIISISLDRKRDWWTTAIKDDHLTWAQYSDLKGDDSQNAKDWYITTIPSYYLVDENWHVVQRDISFSRIAFEVNDYLRHSHSNHAVLQYSKNVIRGQVPYSYASGKLTE